MTQWNTTANNIFVKRYNGKNNFMTPNIVTRQIVHGFAYELSSGSGIGVGTKLYGVTVLDIKGADTGLNEVFDTLAQAEVYIANGFKNAEVA